MIMQELELVIHNPTGLHARPAKIFVNTAKQFKADIRVFHGEKKANAKSLISMLTLGVESGSQIRILVDGDDEVDALESLQAIIASGLGEDALPEESSAEPALAQKTKTDGRDGIPAPSSASQLSGIAAAPGIAIGPVFQYKKTSLKIEETFSGSSEEQDYL